LNVYQIGGVISAIAIGNIIGAFSGGYLLDKINAFYILKTGLIIQGCALSFLIYAKSQYFIFSVLLLMGFGSYLYVTSSNYILNAKFNSNAQSRINIISLQHIISNFGMFFSAILIGYAAEGYYGKIFFLISMVILFTGIFLKPLNKNYYLKREEDQNNVSTYHSSYYLLGIISIALVGSIYAQHKVGFPLYLEEAFGNINTGFLLSLNPLIVVFFQNILIKKTKKYEFPSLILGFFLHVLSIGLLFNIPSYHTVITSIFLLTFGEILVVTYAQSITFGYSPKNKKGFILGIYKAAYSFSRISGSWISGIILFHGNYRSLWVSISLISFVGLLMVIGFTPVNKKHSKLIEA
jgi:predicted MFS family arabinose efflux permease